MSPSMVSSVSPLSRMVSASSLQTAQCHMRQAASILGHWHVQLGPAFLAEAHTAGGPAWQIMVG